MIGIEHLLQWFNVLLLPIALFLWRLERRVLLIEVRLGIVPMSPTHRKDGL